MAKTSLQEVRDLWREGQKIATGVLNEVLRRRPEAADPEAADAIVRGLNPQFESLERVRYELEGLATDCRLVRQLSAIFEAPSMEHWRPWLCGVVANGRELKWLCQYIHEPHGLYSLSQEHIIQAVILGCFSDEHAETNIRRHQDRIEGAFQRACESVPQKRNTKLQEPAEWCMSWMQQNLGWDETGTLSRAYVRQALAAYKRARPSKASRQLTEDRLYNAIYKRCKNTK